MISIFGLCPQSGHRVKFHPITLSQKERLAAAGIACFRPAEDLTIRAPDQPPASGRGNGIDSGVLTSYRHRTGPYSSPWGTEAGRVESGIKRAEIRKARGKTDHEYAVDRSGMQGDHVGDRKSDAAGKLLNISPVVANPNLMKRRLLRRPSFGGFDDLLQVTQLIRNLFGVLELKKQRTICRGQITDAIQAGLVERMEQPPRASQGRRVNALGETDKQSLRAKFGN